MLRLTTTSSASALSCDELSFVDSQRSKKNNNLQQQRRSLGVPEEIRETVTYAFHRMHSLGNESRRVNSEMRKNAILGRIISVAPICLFGVNDFG